MDSRSFPKNFMWGAATSSHQVEGNNFFNDWWNWEQNGNTEASLLACNHYNKFKEDFILAKELGHNAHRLSLEWSRLEKYENVWDQNEWNHYKSVLDELHRLGITPIVTLNHFTVPLWFAQKGSWLNPNSVEIFTRFAKKCIQELGTKIQYWITINEPHILAFLAYYYGDWPPCKKNFNEALLVLKNMLKSHAKIYTIFHNYAAANPQVLSPKIGIAKAVTAFHPCRPFSLLDRISTGFRSWLHNYSSVSSLVKGKILIPGLPKEKLHAKNTLDFIGLNYYFRQFIHYKKLLGEVCSLDHHPNSGNTTDMGWEIYPKGIYEIVQSFCRYNLPIMITENGIATKNDSIRMGYIKSHLSELAKAINEGAPVIGYMHWSLLDNFEWAEGYSKRFGLVHVDYKTQKRTIKDSARYYAQIIKTGEIK
ncbi:MAG: glycoside hydrolase family 1 protein [Candidatus Omnitrophota bacterium]